MADYSFVAAYHGEVAARVAILTILYLLPNSGESGYGF